jgi:type I pantothenate kinase
VRLILHKETQLISVGYVSGHLALMPHPNLRYSRFSRSEWADLRHHDEHVLLDAHRIEALKSINDHLTNEDIEEVYLPLIRLIELHFEAAQMLVTRTSRFLRVPGVKVPFILGIAGSVAVGKSTTSRVLEYLLTHPRRGLRVAMVPTDGFLLPTAELEARGLLDRKGFPESYDVKLLIDFLSSVKSGVSPVRAPVYSHIKYDRVPGESIAIEEPDVLILEGINILQPPPGDGRSTDRRVVSDFIDLSIFIHAEEELLLSWYVNRFLTFRETVFSHPDSHFQRYRELSDEAAVRTATHIWETINGKNLKENVLPTRYRADIILNKGPEHKVEWVEIKKG